MHAGRFGLPFLFVRAVAKPTSCGYKTHFSSRVGQLQLLAKPHKTPHLCAMTATKCLIGRTSTTPSGRAFHTPNAKTRLRSDSIGEIAFGRPAPRHAPCSKSQCAKKQGLYPEQYAANEEILYTVVLPLAWSFFPPGFLILVTPTVEDSEQSRANCAIRNACSDAECPLAPIRRRGPKTQDPPGIERPVGH